MILKKCQKMRRKIVALIFKIIPTTRAFKLKAALLRWCGHDVMVDAQLCSTTRIMIGGRLTVGTRSWVGHDAIFVGGNADICIGADVDIGPGVMMVTGSHVEAEPGKRAAGAGISQPIAIGQYCWIGARSTILGGVTLDEGVIVAAGSLVNRSFPKNCVIGGVPARLIRARADSDGDALKDMD
jgi:maltose O-acetyltransferase